MTINEMISVVIAKSVKISKANIKKNFKGI